MGLLSWVIVGGIAGLLAQYLMGEGGGGCIVTVFLGIIGAFVGGMMMSFFGVGGIDGLSIWSIIVATIGAVVVLAVFRTVRRV